ncbi:brachyurin-like [Atheta coriaria]|uniref:brachyurin-like n=1 Tax=Dalotia coriaria TaxID=877792 RepID=UPI0031F3386B
MKFLVAIGLLAGLSAVVANIEDFGAAEGTVTPNEEIDEEDIGMGGRIINGRLAVRGQFPWQAVIRYKTAGFWGTTMICGASLISPTHLLTAAHCLYENTVIQIILGSTTPYDTSDQDRLTPQVKRVFYNKGYNPADLSNDIGIIELKEPVTYTDVIKPVKLQKSDEFLDENVPVTISGWGQVSDFPKITVSYLNFVELRTIKNADCKKTFGAVVKDYTLCTVGEQGRNICAGDSGGPLVTYDSAGEATQVGIVSFVAARGCTLGLPSGYIRVSSALPWIERVTGLSFN